MAADTQFGRIHSTLAAYTPPECIRPGLKPLPYTLDRKKHEKNENAKVSSIFHEYGHIAIVGYGDMGIWGYGDLGIWGRGHKKGIGAYGDIGVWGCGDVGMCEYGDVGIFGYMNIWGCGVCAVYIYICV